MEEQLKMSFTFKVRSYECGPDGAATLATIGNYLQEAAGEHAEALGFSKSNFEAAGANISWVLTRLRVKMSRYPRWGETVTLETYPRGGRRITAYRDFILSVGGERLGVATSEWMIIDLSTRKIVPVPASVYEHVDDALSPVLGSEPFTKLSWACAETAGEKSFRAQRGHIDLNGHVNNVHYVEWLVETLPETVGPIRDFEIVFKSETLAGEEVRAASVEVEPGVWAAHVASSGGQNHVIARLIGGGPVPREDAFGA